MQVSHSFLISSSKEFQVPPQHVWCPVRNFCSLQLFAANDLHRLVRTWPRNVGAIFKTLRVAEIFRFNAETFTGTSGKQVGKLALTLLYVCCYTHFAVAINRFLSVYFPLRVILYITCDVGEDSFCSTWRQNPARARQCWSFYWLRQPRWFRVPRCRWVRYLQEMIDIRTLFYASFVLVQPLLSVSDCYFLYDGTSSFWLFADTESCQFFET